MFAHISERMRKLMEGDLGERVRRRDIEREINSGGDGGKNRRRERDMERKMEGEAVGKTEGEMKRGTGGERWKEGQKGK